MRLRLLISLAPNPPHQCVHRSEWWGQRGWKGLDGGATDRMWLQIMDVFIIDTHAIVCPPMRKPGDFRQKVRSSCLKPEVKLKLSYTQKCRSKKKSAERQSLSELQGYVGRDRWKRPVLPRCFPWGLPIHSVINDGMALCVWLQILQILLVGSTSCGGLNCIFLAPAFSGKATSAAGRRVEECTVRKWWFMQWWVTRLLM